jgi:hypothetical protein
MIVPMTNTPSRINIAVRNPPRRRSGTEPA